MDANTKRRSENVLKKLKQRDTYEFKSEKENLEFKQSCHFYIKLLHKTGYGSLAFFKKFPKKLLVVLLKSY